jgi:hypothetical protein
MLLVNTLRKLAFSSMNYHAPTICPYELLILHYTPMKYHFVIKDPLSSVKDVKLKGQLYYLQHCLH